VEEVGRFVMGRGAGAAAMPEREEPKKKREII